MLFLQILLFVVGLVQAATIFDCKGSCFGNAIEATKCSSRNTQCICSSPAFMETLTECVQTTCSAESSASAVTYAESFCKTIAGIERRDANGFPWSHNSHGVGSTPAKPKPVPVPVPAPAPDSHSDGGSQSVWEPTKGQPKWYSPGKSWNNWKPVPTVY